MKQSALLASVPVRPAPQIPRALQKLFTPLAQHHTNQDWTALHTACEQMRVPAQLGLPEKVLLACWHSEALDNLGQHQEAIEKLKDYERNEILRARLHPWLVGLVDMRLATTYGFGNEIPYAITLARQALTIFTEGKRRGKIEDVAALALLPALPVLQGETQVVLGRLYRTLGETPIAYDYLTQAIATLTPTTATFLLAQAHLNLGVLLTQVGEFTTAKTALQQAMLVVGTEQLRRQPLLHGKIASNLGGLNAMRGDIRAALPQQEIAVNYLTQAGHARLLVHAQSNLGDHLMRLGQWERATTLLTTALPAMRGGRFNIATANALNTLGELQALQGNFAAAHDLLAENLATIRQARFGYGEIEALLTQGQVWLWAGQPAAAAESFTQAQSLSQKIQSRSEEVIARLFLAEVACEQDDYVAAHHTLTALRPTVEATNHWQHLAHWRELQGRVCAAQGQLVEAAMWLRQALTLWELNGDVVRLAKACLHLGQALQAKGETAAAAFLLQQATSVCQALPCPPLLVKLAKLTETAKTTSRSDKAERDAHDNLALLGSLRLQAAHAHPELLYAELVDLLSHDCGLGPVSVLAWQEPVLQPVAWSAGAEAKAHQRAHDLQTKAHYRTDQWVGTLPANLVFPFGTAAQPLLLTLGQPLPTAQQLLLRSWLDTINHALQLHAHQAQSPQRFTPTITAATPTSLPLPGLIYKSAAMGQVAARIHQLRGSRIPVLITGETGTGKELIARAIHELSERAEHPFLAINCAALPAELMEAELFGYKKGAFTGAKDEAKGLIREAAGGTLFLDELGELPKALQPKLLRFLQEHEVRGLGEAHAEPVDVRVIAATNCALETMVAKQEFREDLYYRINVMRIDLPPLRERREEIALFLTHYLQRYRTEYHKPACEFSPEAWQALLDYDWPGNVRQLAHEVNRALALANDEEPIPVILLSAALQAPPKGKVVALPPRAWTEHPGESLPTLAAALAETERSLIQTVFTKHKRNLSATAAELGITRLTLRNKLKEYGV